MIANWLEASDFGGLTQGYGGLLVSSDIEFVIFDIGSSCETGRTDSGSIGNDLLAL